MHTAVSAKRDTLAELRRRFHVRRLEVSGSAARGVDFDAQRSDADLLIEFEPGGEPDLAGFLDLKDALEQALGRPIDLVDRRSIEQSRNCLRRRRILQEAEPIFVAG
jgi:predicted nucleotidyltransferase